MAKETAVAMDAFSLDERLANDTEYLFDWPLSRVLLMKDANYPWCILVPRVQNEAGDPVTELYHLSSQQRSLLDKESMALAQTMMTISDGRKMNIAALGNVVAQLHIHHVVRQENDPAWPAPVWGFGAPKPYSSLQLERFKSQLVNALDGLIPIT